MLQVKFLTYEQLSRVVSHEMMEVRLRPGVACRALKESYQPYTYWTSACV